MYMGFLAIAINYFLFIESTGEITKKFMEGMYRFY